MTDEQRAALTGIVAIDKDIMHGTPCFAGTRVPFVEEWRPIAL